MKGNWIWADGVSGVDTYADFADGFSYAGGSVTVRVSCDGNYALWINGALAGFSQYADYPWHKFYNEHEVTSLLREGENEVKITVWHYGAENFSYFLGKPCLWYEVECEGETVAASSEETRAREAEGYVCGMAKRITDQLGFSFRYDQGKKGGAYAPAILADVAPDVLEKRPISNLRLGEFAEGREVSPRIYDLGRETVGLLRIVYRAKAGQEITVAYGEHLTDGEVRQRIHSRDFSVSVVAGGGEEEYFNPFRRIGGRYLQVKGECEILSLGLLPTEYPFRVRQVRFDDDRRNAIYQTAVRTLTLCHHEHYEDCPWREQGLYGLDGRLQMLFGYHAFRNPECQRASLALFALCTNEDGLLPICSPTSDRSVLIPSFSLFFVIAMREYIAYTGDVSLARRHREMLLKILAYFIGNMRHGLVRKDAGYWNFYEWSESLDGKYPPSEDTDCMINCVFSMALGCMAEILDILRDHETAKDYRILRECLNQRVADTFYDEEAGVFTMFPHAFPSECVNAFAILSGAAKGAVAATVAEKIAMGEVPHPATLSMKAFKYDALLAVSREKYAPCVLFEIDEVFGRMLDAGATSFWETELGEADFGGAGSLCHGWSALPVYFYSILDPTYRVEEDE